MTPLRARQPADCGDGGRRGTVLRNVAFAILVAVLASRVFLSDVPYRTSAFPFGSASLSAGAPMDGQTGKVLLADRNEAARVTFAVGLLSATALWMLAGAVDRRLKLRRAHLAWLISAFAVISLASAMSASDKRTALDVWLEQVSLLSAGFLTVQLCADRRRFAVVVIVLAATAVAMAVKGYYEVFVEIPDRIADFEANTARRLAQADIEPGTARAKLFEARLRDTSPLGFFSLANVFASLLVMLMAVGAGLAVDKFRSARRDTRTRRKGEIDVGLLAGFLTLAVVVAVVPVWLLTRSMGAIASGTAVLIGGTLVFVLRNRLARHRRKAVLAVASLWVVAAAGVVGYGLARDRLPTKTMTFRWYYWTASAGIVQEEPLLGAGPGNFPDAYLRHRRPAGEEAVKNPHNAVVHAVSEYGLLGGAMYLAVPVVMLIAASRPREITGGKGRTSARSELSSRGAVIVACVVTATVFASRAVFSEARADALLLVLDGMLPALVLLGGLAIMSLSSSGVSGALDIPAGGSRVALVAAAVGFLLHNMVGFSLWAPATGLVFYVALGAALAQAGGCKPTVLRRAALPAALVGIVAVLAVAVLLCGPVYRRAAYCDRAAGAIAENRPMAAERLLIRTAEADPLDPLSAGEAARFTLTRCREGTAGLECLSRAQGLALTAVDRDPASARWRRLAGEIAGRIAGITQEEQLLAEALRHMQSAVERDPMNMRIRLDYAEMLQEAGKSQECLEQLRRIEQIDRQLWPESVQRLTPGERRRIELLRERAGR